MDNFELRDAAEWQSVSRKKKASRGFEDRSGSSNPRRNQRHPQIHKPNETLIDLDLSESDKEREAPFGSSNPFASLRLEESAPSTNPVPVRSKHEATSAGLRTASHRGVQQPLFESASGRKLTQGGQSRASSTSIDDFPGLDPNFWLTPSSTGASSSTDRATTAGFQKENNFAGLLDGDVPPKCREEDEAWFTAQSEKKTAPTGAQYDTSRHQFRHPAQSVYPVGMPVTPSYRGYSDSHNHLHSVGHGRSDGGPPSNYGQPARGENHASHSRASELSMYTHTSSNDTSDANSRNVRGSKGQSIARGQSYRPQASLGPVAGMSSKSLPISKGMDTIRPSGITLVDKVAHAIEAGAKVQSLALHHDSAATTEWRRKKGIRPGRIIPLPRGVNLAGMDFDADSSSRPAIARPAEIGVITNTHIDQVWGTNKDTKTVKLLVYGSEEAIEEAAKLVGEWLREIRKAQERWPKTWGHDKKAESKLKKRLIRDEQLKKYRQIMPENETLAHSIQVIWSLPKEPEQVLGMNFEALDPIRLNCECYIWCEKNPQPILYIQGNHQQKIREASDRMNQLPAEWYAKMFEAESFVILDVPCALSPNQLPPVSKIPYHLPQPLLERTGSGTNGVGFGFKYPPQSGQVSSSALKGSLAVKLRDAVVQTTQHARFFRNILRLHLRMGTYVARMTHRPDMDENTYSFPAFAEMMEENEKMDARVSMEIGAAVQEEHILQRCFQASHILAPQDAWAAGLADVKPVYCATFEILNPAGKAGNLLLEVELSTEGGRTSVVSRSWCQLAKGKREPRNLLDCSIVDLQDGGLAWHLGMDEFMSVDERGLSPDYQVFPDTLRLDNAAAADLSGLHNFIIYRRDQDQAIKVPIKSVRQRRCWRFNSIGSRGEWVVEAAHVVETIVHSDGQQTIFEPRWTFNVTNNNWDKLLASNKHAEIGQVAKWGRGNPANLLFPLNPDSSTLPGFARQDGEVSSEESEGEEDGELDGAGQEKSDSPAYASPPNLRNFEQLLELLRMLTDVATGRSCSDSSTDRANESTEAAWW